MTHPVSKPLIGISGPTRGAYAPRVLVYLAIRLSGGRAVQLSPARPRPNLALAGLVITGGHDVEPVLYAEEPTVTPRYDRERDAFESQLIDQALTVGRPLLGICRGAQLLNVCLGGSLHQDLNSQRRRTSKRRTILPLKTLSLETGSGVQRLLDCQRCRINSLHNQAIARLGQGLQVVGRDLDEIVQAVESPGQRFLLGVQWHPEMLPYRPRQWRLFAALVQAARAFAEEQAQEENAARQLAEQ